MLAGYANRRRPTYPIAGSRSLAGRLRARAGWPVARRCAKCFNSVSLESMQCSTVLPAAPGTDTRQIAAPKNIDEEVHERLFHVVLLDDDEHTYDYVIEMLQKLFLFSAKIALDHAIEVDTTGRTIVITCERPQAEFARDQIQSYGADPRMPNSKGSMSAVLVPVKNSDVDG